MFRIIRIALSALFMATTFAGMSAYTFVSTFRTSDI